ncbi:hypothetical protein [Methylocaldum sp.]|uniref:hypothetical protein n=1 Tax=Methylocaldum sp. TaxID=1969727 RepID=UPI002D66DA8B|nr:hypothetical protein [Methylocaldum sp.]HYE36213.1 hypothetical protein [Methylocaldum sp.]
MLPPLGTSKNLALRQAQCERLHENQAVPFVLSLSKHERNRFFEVPLCGGKKEPGKTTFTVDYGVGVSGPAKAFGCGLLLVRRLG